MTSQHTDGDEGAYIPTPFSIVFLMGLIDGFALVVAIVIYDWMTR
jgi:hypothetical protein